MLIELRDQTFSPYGQARCSFDLVCDVKNRVVHILDTEKEPVSVINSINHVFCRHVLDKTVNQLKGYDERKLEEWHFLLYTPGSKFQSPMVDEYSVTLEKQGKNPFIRSELPKHQPFMDRLKETAHF